MMMRPGEHMVRNGQVLNIMMRNSTSDCLPMKEQKETFVQEMFNA